MVKWPQNTPADARRHRGTHFPTQYKCIIRAQSVVIEGGFGMHASTHSLQSLQLAIAGGAQTKPGEQICDKISVVSLLRGFEAG